MKKYIIELLTAVTAVFLIISQSAFSACAANTIDAVNTIDTARRCSLNVTMKCGDEKFGGTDVRLYRFAVPDEKAKFTLCGDYSGYQLNINGISSQKQWNTLASTLYSYIVADNIRPSYTAKTDSEGRASFSDLPCGLYLAGKITETNADAVTVFSPFVIALPQLGEKNEWVYTSDVHTKGVRSIKESDLVKMRVIKEWRDFPEYRTDSVTADIYCDGELAESVILSEKNNWMYEWNADASLEWNVVERFIPGGYDVEIAQNDTSFFIINTLWPIGGDDTGDNEEDDDNTDDDDGGNGDDSGDDGDEGKRDDSDITEDDDTGENTVNTGATGGSDSSSVTTTKKKKSTSGSSSDDEAAETGDTFSLVPYITAISVPFGLYCILTYIGKRRENDKNS